MSCHSLFIVSMSVLRDFAIAAWFARCRIFRLFQQSAHIAHFSAYIGIFDGSFNYFNIICVSI